LRLIRNIELSFDENELILHLGGQLGKEPNPRVQEAIARMLPLAMELAEPAGLFETFPVHKREKKRIYLDEGTYFESALLVKFSGAADRLAVCIYTLGKRLEDRADELMKQGHFLDGALLDSIGTVLLSNTGLKVYDAIKEEADRLGVDASVPASPGQIDWALKQQKTVFDLLDAEQLGVTLTPSFLMIPKKSASIVVGLGQGVVKKGEGRSCDYCPLKDTCPSRKVSDYRLGKASQG